MQRREQRPGLDLERPPGELLDAADDAETVVGTLLQGHVVFLSDFYRNLHPVL